MAAGTAPGSERRSSSKAPAEAERLAALVAGFRDRRVVVLGDLVADEFVYGDIARISREAPVLILEHQRTVVVPGGGGNAVANLRALGARPHPVGVVGDDESGRLLLESFEALGVERAGIRVERGRATPAKSRILAGGVHTRRQQIVRVDRGAPRSPLAAATGAALGRALDRALRGAEGLLVADYGYGTAAPEIVGTRRGVPVLVDSRSRVAAFRGVTACTPNQEELERAVATGPLTDDADVEAAGRKLLRATGNGAVLVTRGARGMVLFERGRPAVSIAAFGSDEVADVTGAGDTVIATFTLALLAGAGFLEASRLANYAAGLVVLKAGTATVDQAELTRAVREAAP